MVDHHPPVQKPLWTRLLCVLGAVVLIAIGIWTVFMAPLAMLLTALRLGMDGEAESFDWWMAVPFGVLALLILLGVVLGLMMCWRGFRPKRVPVY